jgi:stage II sporulation protein D
VRIALAENQKDVRLSASVPWEIFAADGQTPVALTQPGERWVLQREDRSITVMREDSRPVSARESTIIVRPIEAEGQILFNSRRWRGDLIISATGDGLLVVNRLNMDDYLKGVVPQEIGTTSFRDQAAIEAQAVSARSYAVTHLADPARPFDMRANVLDQVYGGASAETRSGNQAVESTSGLVLLYGGQAVNAPYHAACGGTTAEPEDVWRESPIPYLKRVSDQIPGTNRFYCDEAPKHRWTVRLTGEQLRASISRYLREQGRSGANFGRIDAMTVTDVTPGGRVALLTVETDRGPVQLRGNDMRYAIRLASGDLLYSTYFNIDAVTGRSGVESVVLNGGGNGHGIGMCQAGAIGRARAGQDFRMILRTYYPGTTVGTL